MRKTSFLFILVTLFLGSSAFMPQPVVEDKSFQDGEWFKFRIHYGIFNASFATLSVAETALNGKAVYHVKGHGESTGMLDWFFKVEDRYESYFDMNTVKPYRFIRNIDEGGHTKNIQIDFNHDENMAVVNNIKRNKVSNVPITPGTQDMVSAFYHLRNTVDHKTAQVGDEYVVPMFFDKENYDFKLKLLKFETIDTKFGKVRAMKFRPYVQAGRIFKEEESMTVWISADKNKIPVKLQAKLAVGSLTADLDAFKGLKHGFKRVVE